MPIGMEQRQHAAHRLAPGMWGSVAAMASVVVAWSAIPMLVKVAPRSFSPSVIAFMRLALAAAPLMASHLARGGRVADLIPRRGWQLLGVLVVQPQFVSFVVL